MRESIQKGAQVWILHRWRDPGDENYKWFAVENEDGGRIRIMADIGLPINPEYVVTIDMVETVSHDGPCTDADLCEHCRVQFTD